MKILAIRIKNLASLEGLHEIDFTQDPLLSSGIFAITGPTGAGKSTILDALCLALYAKTPRYLQAKESGISLKDVDGSEINQGDARSILRDGTAEGFAEVDFVGTDRKKYRAKWSVSRARQKSTGRLQSYTVELSQIDTHLNLTTKIKETLDKISELVGLNFEQFTRSVLLAQGEFTAFLKADKEQKASLLEKLTGTEIYSRISRQVFHHYSEEKNKLRELQNQADYIELLTPEQVEETEQQLQRTILLSTENKLQLKSIEKQLAAFEQLSILDEKVVGFEQVWQQALAEKEAVQERQTRIVLIESLQPVHHRIREEQQLQKNITELNEHLESSQNALKKTEDEITLLKSDSDKCKALLLQYQSDFKLTKPLIEQAKKLDIQISEKNALKDKQLAELQSALTQQKQQSETITKTEENILSLQNELLQIRQWLENHQSRETIALHQQLILSKLQDASVRVSSVQSLQSESELLEKSFNEYITSIEQKKEEISQLQQQTDTLVSETNARETALKSLSIEDLTQQQKHLTAQKTELFLIQKTWNELTKNRTLTKELQLSISSNQQLLTTQKEQLSALEIQLQTDLIILKNTEEIVKTVRMETSENVEKLREQLRPEQPCPVCGSSEHPYSTTHPAAKNPLSVLEEKLQAAKDNFQNTQNNIIRLSESIILIEKQITQTEATVSKNVAELELLHQEWNNFAMVRNLSDITDITQWISDTSSGNEAELLFIEKSIGLYHQLSKEKEKFQQQWTFLKSQTEALQSTLSETEKIQLTITEKQEHLNKNLQQHLQLLDELKVYLQQYFPQPDWFDNWKSAPDAFIEKIQKFASEWNSKKEQLQALQEQLKEAENLLIHQKNLSENILLSVQQKNEACESSLHEINTLQTERNQLFAGKPVLAVEAEFQQYTEQAQTELDTYLSHLQEQEKQRTIISTSIQHTTDTLNKTSEQSEQNRLYTEQWLSQKQLSYSFSELSQILDFSQEWYIQEQQFLHQINDKCKSSYSLLEEALKNKQEHQENHISETGEQLLSEQKSALESHIGELTQAEFRLKHTLERDRTEKKSKEQLFKKIEQQQAIAHQWGSLNELIGSADGKKFKQLAQEYTLDILVEYANIHLQSLTKRYLLQRIPDSLALQVCDLDMGEEIRSVFSLSGGESFLVSLALALGLASLSSNRMRVESLFIDEGFGSLDPHTLNIAMDALENLHQQGRKVGVISHVQEMTERIPVQIRVTRVQTGRSTIQIAG